MRLRRTGTLGGSEFKYLGKCIHAAMPRRLSCSRFSESRDTSKLWLRTILKASVNAPILCGFSVCIKGVRGCE